MVGRCRSPKVAKIATFDKNRRMGREGGDVGWISTRALRAECTDVVVTSWGGFTYVHVADVDETTVLFEEVEISQEGWDGRAGRARLDESSCAPRSTFLFHTTFLYRRLRAVSFI